MDFGALHTVTAWRVTKAGEVCQGVVMSGPEGFRLVVILGQRIVEWTRFARAVELRRHVRSVRNAYKRTGFVPCGRALDGSDAVVSTRPTRHAARQLSIPDIPDHSSLILKP